MQTHIEIFLIGLFGSMHCISMCGGFVGMYSLKKPAAKPSLPYHILYNLGRILTYSFIGGIVGYAGSFVSYLGEHRGIPGTVLLIAGVIMILMGMNLAGVLGKRRLFDDAGVTGTTLFRSLFRRILTFENVWGTFLLGLLLGFLPCGLLYPVFIHAAASGSFSSGVLITALFGLGTAPAMMSFGLLVTRLKPAMKLLFYRFAAILIIVLGARTLLRGMAFNGWIPAGRFW